MDVLAVITVALAFLAFGLISRRLDGSLLTGPMLFAGFGLLVGPLALDLVPVQVTNATFHMLAEVTLILVLFSDAANIDFRQLKKDHNLSVRMLAIGMPLTIVFGAFAVLLLLPGFSVWEAALLAAILTPTDAALGEAVVTNERVPLRIRQALSVESGLNDGIALPFVLIFASLASAMGGTEPGEWLLFGAKQVILGPMVGVFIGFVGAKLVARCYRSDWMEEWAEGVIALSLALGAYASAEFVHGNGFIAAFVTGLVFANTLSHKCEYLYKFAKTEGQFFVLGTFLLFGCAMVPTVLADLEVRHLIFAVLSLTVLRMLPVSLALLGTRVRPVTSGFLGWFGPRGLASIVFVLLILEEVEVPHKSEIFAITILTVGLSILLHGVTAGPAAQAYGAKAKAMGTCTENQPITGAHFFEKT